MKEELCEAFCSDLKVRDVPAGIAVGTGFMGIGGDPIGFYIIGPDNLGLWRIQDDGNTMPLLEAEGADLGIESRKEAFDDLMEEYGATYDEDVGELAIVNIKRGDLPQAALKFVALLLRIQDMLLLTRDRAEATWIEEATRDLTAYLQDKARIEEDVAVSPALSDYPADLVIRAAGDRAPVALFFGVSDVKVYEALLLRFSARALAERCEVVVLLEKDNAVSRKARQRADNNVIAPRYRGGEHEAIARIVEVAIGQSPLVH
jgi:hypothetical protein